MTPTDPVTRLRASLERDYMIALPPAYAVVVEGTTDRDYLRLAADLARAAVGEELLGIPPGAAAAQTEIAVLVPASQRTPNRGGASRMTAFADDLRTYYQGMGLLTGVVFVFDHDRAGKEEGHKLTKFGYEPGVHHLTLDPSTHHGSCGKENVVIEDLLSLAIQHRFFDWFATPSCAVEYKRGKRFRYCWDDDCKPHLRDFVLAHAAWADLKEVGRLLARVRECWGFPVDGRAFD